MSRVYKEILDWVRTMYMHMKPPSKEDQRKWIVVFVCFLFVFCLLLFVGCQIVPPVLTTRRIGQKRWCTPLFFVPKP